MGAPTAIGVSVIIGMAVIYVFGGLLVGGIGRTYGRKASTFCIAAVSIAIYGAFVVLVMPIEEKAAASALKSAFFNALPYILGWIVVGVLAYRRVFRKSPSDK